MNIKIVLRRLASSTYTYQQFLWPLLPTRISFLDNTVNRHGQLFQKAVTLLSLLSIICNWSAFCLFEIFVLKCRKKLVIVRICIVREFTTRFLPELIGNCGPINCKWTFASTIAYILLHVDVFYTTASIIWYELVTELQLFNLEFS